MSLVYEVFDVGLPETVSNMDDLVLWLKQSFPEFNLPNIIDNAMYDDNAKVIRVFTNELLDCQCYDYLMQRLKLLLPEAIVDAGNVDEVPNLTKCIFDNQTCKACLDFQRCIMFQHDIVSASPKLLRIIVSVAPNSTYQIRIFDHVSNRVLAHSELKTNSLPEAWTFINHDNIDAFELQYMSSGDIVLHSIDIGYS